MKKKRSWFYLNSLTIVFTVMLLAALAGQAYTGWKQYNNDLEEMQMKDVDFSAYLSSPHFMEATFENWESEFLQMGMYVLLTVSLRQIGSSESKDPEKPEEVDREPQPGKDAPWPVNKGGIWLKLYKHSLSIAFFTLFVISFALHFKGSFDNYNMEQYAHGEPLATAGAYLLNSKFWFESFQNWQSEFLSVAAIVFLSIYLRQWGSPESKPVDAPHMKTGR